MASLVKAYENELKGMNTSSCEDLSENEVKEKEKKKTVSFSKEASDKIAKKEKKPDQKTGNKLIKVNFYD